MPNKCKKAQQKLAEIKELHKQFDLALENASRVHDIEPVKQLKIELVNKIDQLLHEVDIYNIHLRRELGLNNGYKYVNNFVSNLAVAITNEKKYDVINRQGEKIATDLLSAVNIAPGILQVADYKFGTYLINEAGEKISEGYDEYNKLEGSSYIGAVLNDESFLLDATGKKVSEAYHVIKATGEPDRFFVRKKYSYDWSLIDVKGNILNGPFVPVHKFVEGMAGVKNKKEECFLIDTNGRLITKYLRKGIISEGRALVYKEISGQILWCFVDANNKICGKGYKDAKPFCEGRAAIQKNDDLWYFLDKKGNESEEGYLSVESFADGVARVKYVNGSFCLIDKQYKKVSPDYSFIARDNNRITYQKKFNSQEWFFKNSAGKEIGVIADRIYFPQIKGKSVIMAIDNIAHLKYFVDENGKITSQFFEMVSFSNNNFACGCIDDKWYLLDQNCQTIGEGYDSISPLKRSQGTAKVVKNGIEFYIDDKGKRFP